MSYKKNFDQWNKVLKNLEKRERKVWFAEREIWMVAWGIGSGSEIDGKGMNFGRSALVFRKEENGCFLAVPLTRKMKKLPGRYIYNQSCLVFNQVRTLSPKRLLKKMKKNES